MVAVAVAKVELDQRTKMVAHYFEVDIGVLGYAILPWC